MFGYPSGSAAALLAGVLPLQYCSARFACKFPTWRLPDRGHVCELITDGVFGALVLDNDGTDRDLLPRSVGRAGGSFEGRFWRASNEFGSTEKHQHTLLNVGTWRVFSLVPGFGRDSGFLGLVGVQFVTLMLCMSVIMVVIGLPWMTGLGLDCLGLHWPTSPGFA